MAMSSQEQVDIVRKLRALRWGNVASLSLEIRMENSLKVQVTGDSAEIYTLSPSEGVIYVAGQNTFGTSPDEFGKLSTHLIKFISSIEKQIVERQELAFASSAVQTYLCHDEIRSLCKGDAIFAHYRTLDHRRKVIVEAYKKYRADLTGFPIEIFDKRQYDAPKELFIRARKMLFDASRSYDGTLMEIKNMRPLTTGFRKDGELLFDPLSVYYTKDDASKAFKSQLQKYAEEQK